MVLVGDGELERIVTTAKEVAELLSVSAATPPEHLRTAKLKLFGTVLVGRSVTA